VGAPEDSDYTAPPPSRVNGGHVTGGNRDVALAAFAAWRQGAANCSQMARTLIPRRTALPPGARPGDLARLTRLLLAIAGQMHSARQSAPDHTIARRINTRNEPVKRANSRRLR
jgi:hypothetical protein